MISLPYPPSANRYWRNFRGRMVVSPAARAYKAAVALTLRSLGVRPVEGEVRLTLRFFRPIRSGDLDNFLKVLIDSLNGSVFVDDEQIIKITAERFDAGSKLAGRVEVDWEVV